MIRKSDIDGEACSTCRFVEWGIDRYEMPWHECGKNSFVIITSPDEQVCDDFQHIL